MLHTTHHTCHATHYSHRMDIHPTTRLYQRGLLTPNINNFTSTLYQKEPTSFPTASLHALLVKNVIATIGLLINTIHIGFMSQMPVGKRTGAKNFKIFILTLAYSDLAASCLTLFLNHVPVQRFMYEHHEICVLTATIVHILHLCEAQILLLAAVDRYLAVRNPHRYKDQIFAKHFTKFLTVSIILWTVCYSIIAGLYNKRGYRVKGWGGCEMASIELPRLGLFSAAGVLLNLILIITVYSMLLHRTLRIPTRVRLAPGELHYTRQATLTVGVLVLFKVLLWIPPLAVDLLRTMDFKHEDAEMSAIAFISIDLYHVISPVLYGSTSRRYRQFIRSKLSCGVNTTKPVKTVILKSESSPMNI